MASFNSLPGWKNIGVGLLAIIGMVCIINLSRQAFWNSRRPSVASPEQIAETFRKADEKDRENWAQMWKEAGKEPPPIPSMHSSSPR